MGSRTSTVGVCTPVKSSWSGSEMETPIIPDKSRSLRKTSVRKRLETEVNRKTPRTKEKLSKKARLSKYRRKSANAKERERMKKQNDVFEVLKEILPCHKSDKKSEEDKETKVTTLRAAILYINSLKSLLADCEAGRVDSEVLRQCSLTSSSPEPSSSSSSSSSPSSEEKRKKKRSPIKKKILGKKIENLEPKWTHYSKQDLRTKFEPKSAPGSGSQQSSTSPPPPSSAAPSAPPAPPPAYSLPITPPPPYSLPTQPLSPAPAYQTPSLLYCSSPTTTTYLCQAATTFVPSPSDYSPSSSTPTSSSSSSSSCSPSPSYYYDPTTSSIVFTEGELVSSCYSPSSSPSSPSCSMYSPTPSSPRDVNEISLHISLLDSQTQVLTY